MSKRAIRATSPKHEGLSSVSEVDEEILLRLPYNDILKICGSSKKYSELCVNDYLWRRLVERDFIPDMIDLKPNDISYRQQYKDLHHALDHQEQMLDFAVRAGRTDILEQLYELDHNLIMDMDLIESKGHLKAIEWLYNHKFKISASEAASHGRIDVLEWMMDQGIYMNERTANSGAAAGPRVLQWLEDRGIHPNAEAMLVAAMNGRMDSLIWLDKRGMRPTGDLLIYPVEDGDIKMLEWFEMHDLLPDNRAPAKAASYGRRNVLEWLYLRGILPDVNAANQAATWGHLNILKWLEEHNIMPDQKGVDKAAMSQRVEILNWLYDRGILPSDRAIYAALSTGEETIMNWAVNHSIPLTDETVRDAISRNDNDMLQWIVNYASMTGYTDVVEWFGQRGIYPDR